MMLDDVLMLLPESLLALGIVVLLLSKTFYRPRTTHYALLCAVVYLSALIALMLSNRLPAESKQILFTFDAFSYFGRGCALSMGILSIPFLHSAIRRDRMPEIETYCLCLIQSMGMLFTLMSATWISLIVGLECMYLPLYALLATRAEDRTSQEAACKYIIMGAFSSGLLLYGVSFLYATVGRFEISALSGIVQSLTVSGSSLSWLTAYQSHVMFSIGGLLVTAALCFKLGIVPFHFWVRDVYEGGSYTVVGILSATPKLVLISVWLRIFTPAVVSYIPQWSFITLSVGILSMFFGNVLALAQDRIRSLLAYSSFGHMGFVLLALVILSAPGNQAAVVYTIGYGLTIFIVLMSLGRISMGSLPCHSLEDLKGLSAVRPVLSVALAVSFLSLLGMPPFLGFMFKVNLLAALFQANQVGIALAVVVATLIGAFYYIRMIGLMYFYDVPKNRGYPVVVQSGYVIDCLLVVYIATLLYVGLNPAVVLQLMSVITA